MDVCVRLVLVLLLLAYHFPRSKCEAQFYLMHKNNHNNREAVALYSAKKWIRDIQTDGLTRHSSVPHPLFFH